MPNSRRAVLLRGLATVSALAAWRGAQAASRVHRFAAAWDDDHHRHFVGLVDNMATAPALRIVQKIELPTRAHGLVVEPDGGIVAAARRPGDWMLRWQPYARTAPQWCWSAGDRRFCGHVIHVPDAGTRARLYTTEVDLATGQGLLVQREAASLEVEAEWPTHGIDPHAALRDTDGSLLVANGGVPTQPETGRTKLARGTMDPSLVRLDARTGALLGQWRLHDTRLSIRHLARHTKGTVGISLQAEHEDASVRAAAPLLALFDGNTLRVAAQPDALAGYGGDITATPDGFAVAATRAGQLAFWNTAGVWQGSRPLTDACPLAWTRDGELWAGGSRSALQRADRPDPRPHGVGPLRLDNHWAAWED